MINGVTIDDTFAEAFGMSGDRPGHHRRYDQVGAHLRHGGITGFGTSVIGCGAECGIDYEVSPKTRPTGGPACAC